MDNCEPTKPNGRSDHDILIEIGVKLDRAIDDIKGLGKGVVESTAQLRESKLEKDVFNRWETDFRREFEKELGLIKEGLVKDLGEISKTFQTGFKDHEDRLRRLERYVWIAIGGLAILQIIVGFAK